MDDLTLQIGFVHRVRVDDAYVSHARRGEVQEAGTAESAGPYHEHARILEGSLAGHADVAQHEVPRVSRYFRVVQALRRCM